MLNEALFSGEQIKALIPQREPIIMLDTFYDVTEDECRTGLTISSDNLFCDEECFGAVGLIEHIAQSASAFMGYKSISQNKSAVIGYIGEVKGFKQHEKVYVGDRLFTTIIIRTQVMNVTMIEAETRTEKALVANCQMKLSMEE